MLWVTNAHNLRDWYMCVIAAKADAPFRSLSLLIRVKQLKSQHAAKQTWITDEAPTISTRFDPISGKTFASVGKNWKNTNAIWIKIWMARLDF